MTEPSAPTPERTARRELVQDSTIGTVRLTHWDNWLGRHAASTVTALGHRIGAYGALTVILLAGTGFAFVMAFLAAHVYDQVTEQDGVAVLDRPLLDAAIRVRTPQLDGLAAGIAYLFGTIGMPAMAVTAILILALRRRSWTPLILVAGAGAGSLLMTVAGKTIVGRPRPLLSAVVAPFEYSPSFPSGHTLNATVIAGMVGYLLWLRRRTIAGKIACLTVPILIAITVGLSRVLLGAHWFTDVAAAWLLGAAWLAVIVTAHRLYLTARQRDAPLVPIHAKATDQREHRPRR